MTECYCYCYCYRYRYRYRLQRQHACCFLMPLVPRMLFLSLSPLSLCLFLPCPIICHLIRSFLFQLLETFTFAFTFTFTFSTLIANLSVQYVRVLLYRPGMPNLIHVWHILRLKFVLFVLFVSHRLFIIIQIYFIIIIWVRDLHTSSQGGFSSADQSFTTRSPCRVAVD